MDLPIEKMPSMTDAEASIFWARLTQEMMVGEDEAARETLAAGMPIYYSEIDTPENQAIKEYPDGRKELIEFLRENGKRGERLIRVL